MNCEAIARIDTSIGSALGGVASGMEIALRTVGYAIADTAKKIALFIKNNWRPLIAYILAWAVIITSTGLMYGFDAVALPLTIGMACGLMFGIIMGILTVKVFDPSGKITPWNLLNQGIEKLDPNGTRQIVLAVAVTVLLAAAVVFPYVIGAVFGLIVGSQLATKIGSGRDLGKNLENEEGDKQSFKLKINTMEQDILQMNDKIQRIQDNSERVQLEKQMYALQDQLKKMHKTLHTLYPT